ncbi:metal-dependent hydrolase [Candidatus Tokpelaia sp.]|uniref:metal-dependent hydrolase n=1 Tax=Candidatus Tokpelaia sp. TaxID=2233777 RepID=UPI00123B46E3|nr:metal-dependent hydrolase [Candidatus Tokpelaia sp.]KAA6404844.1 metal-dependent hydrolase [Candidatus Tokpelaia sp.]
MKITWLGHAAFRIEVGEAVILIDPFLSGNAKLAAAGLDMYKAAEGLTHIALTHGHGDHLGDTIALAREKNVPVSANADLAAWLKARGVERIMPGNTGGTQRHETYTLTFVNALHSSAVMEENGLSSSLGNPNGLIFHFTEAPTVYHMGDTDIFSDMQLIDELHRPVIGLVPIGDCFTMGGAVAALACRRYLNLRYALPCHYGTFPLLDQTADKFITAMKGAQTEVKAPQIGEMLEF